MSDPFYEEIGKLAAERDALRKQNAAMREALQKAYHALQWSEPFSARTCNAEITLEQSEKWHEEATKAISAALQPDAGARYLSPEQWKFCYDYACRLFKHRAPQCECLDDLPGVLTQLDNLLCGMVWKDDLKSVASALRLVWDASTLDEGDGLADLDAEKIKAAVDTLKSLGL